LAVLDGLGRPRPFLEAALALVPILGERLRSPGVLEPQLGQVLAMLGDIEEVATIP
jgi:hypothetical protein